jgi:hypothetical protein
MKKSVISAVVFIILITTTGLGCDVQNTTVQGMVVDATNQVGISGATVAAGIYSSITDASGEYSFTMPTDSGIFIVTAPGYKNQSQQMMGIEEGRSILNFGLVDRFHTTGVIQGTVANSKTIDPIEGAYLVFTSNDKTYKVESIHLGAYAIELPVDFSSGVMTYSVNVTAKNYQNYSGSVTVSNGRYDTKNILMKP